MHDPFQRYSNAYTCISIQILRDKNTGGQLEIYIIQYQVASTILNTHYSTIFVMIKQTVMI